MEQVLVDQQKARRFMADTGSAIGVPEDDALLFADALVEADLRGLVTHGIVRLPQYIERIKRGAMEPKLNLRVVQDWPWGGLIDAGNGIGHVAAARGMQWVIAKAQGHGIGAAAMRMSNHLGMAAYYALMAAKQGCIGIVATNSAPIMAPWGGREPKLGNNPIAMGVPTDAVPIVFDMACSKVARGKVFKAQREGQEIPPDWALDPEGRPTTNPAEALKGAMLPLAEHKGYGLALMADLLAGVLSGGAFGPWVKTQEDYSGPRNACHFFLALNIEYFRPLGEFKKSVGQYVEALHNTQPAVGFAGVRVPGEGGEKTRQQRLATGIPYHVSTIRLLDKLASDLNIRPLTA